MEIKADEITKINAPLQKIDCCFASLSKMFTVSLRAYGILGLVIAIRGKEMVCLNLEVVPAGGIEPPT